MLCGLFALFPVGCLSSSSAMNSVEGWVIQTDFSSDDQWAAIRDLIIAEQPEFPFVNFVSDLAHRDQSVADVVRSLPDNYPALHCYIVDRDSIENPEHPVLVVGFYAADHKSLERSPRETPEGEISTFRALPSQIWSIEANLSLSNLGFDEFEACVDADGVFRGYPPPRAQRPAN